MKLEGNVCSQDDCWGAGRGHPPGGRKASDPATPRQAVRLTAGEQVKRGVSSGAVWTLPLQGGDQSPALRPDHVTPLCKAPPAYLRIPLHHLALFLDIDGTLAPITARPELTRIPFYTRRILLSLQARGVALAALSGRPLAQARRLLCPVQMPCGGSHGAQIGLSAGRCIRAIGVMPHGMADLLEEGISRLSGVWLERKPGAYALHWRQAPERRNEVARLAQQALERAPGWRLLTGHCVHELRPPGRDKGVALRRLMRLPAFSGRWPLAIGDDRTDEDAFKAALALGGGALRVGPGASTAAPWGVQDTRELAAWLRAQHEC